MNSYINPLQQNFTSNKISYMKSISKSEPIRIKSETYCRTHKRMLYSKSRKSDKKCVV